MLRQSRFRCAVLAALFSAKIEISDRFQWEVDNDCLCVWQADVYEGSERTEYSDAWPANVQLRGGRNVTWCQTKMSTCSGTIPGSKQPRLSRYVVHMARLLLLLLYWCFGKRPRQLWFIYARIFVSIEAPVRDRPLDRRARREMWRLERPLRKSN